MTYVVTENCIRCKYMDCVEVCPVDCFYAGENFLVIAPDECIDCGVCEPECPADAIVADTDPRATPDWLELNAGLAKIWPNITAKGEPRPTPRNGTASPASWPSSAASRMESCEMLPARLRETAGAALPGLALARGRSVAPAVARRQAVPVLG